MIDTTSMHAAACDLARRTAPQHRLGSGGSDGDLEVTGRSGPLFASIERPGPDLLVCDPCYGPSDGGAVRVSDCVAGSWVAFTERRRFPVVDHEGVIWYDDRISALEMRVASLEGDAYRRELRWQLIEGEVQVELGQCGIWRSDAPLGQGEYHEPDSFYGRACMATRYPPPAAARADGLACGAMMPEGAVSSSGYGDGGYPVLVAQTRDGRAFAIRVEFIDPSEGEPVSETDAVAAHLAYETQRANELQRLRDARQLLCSLSLRAVQMNGVTQFVTTADTTAVIGVP